MRKSYKKWFWIGILTVIALIFLVPFFVSFFITTEWIETKVSAMLQCPVKMKNVSYSLFSGKVSVENMEIRHSNASISAPYLKTQISFISFLLENRIELRKIWMEKPSIRIVIPKVPVLEEMKEKILVQCESIEASEASVQIESELYQSALHLRPASIQIGSITDLSLPFSFGMEAKLSEIAGTSLKEALTIQANGQACLGKNTGFKLHDAIALNIGECNVSVFRILEKYLPAIRKIQGKVSCKAAAKLTEAGGLEATGELTARDLQTVPFAFEKANLTFAFLHDPFSAEKKKHLPQISFSGNVYAQNERDPFGVQGTIPWKEDTRSVSEIELRLQNFPFHLLCQDREKSKGIYGIHGKLSDFMGKLNVEERRAQVQGEGNLQDLELHGKLLDIAKTGNDTSRTGNEAVKIGKARIMVNLLQEGEKVTLEQMNLERDSCKIAIRGEVCPGPETIQSILSVKMEWQKNEMPDFLRNLSSQAGMSLDEKNKLSLDIQGNIGNFRQCNATGKCSFSSVEFDGLKTTGCKLNFQLQTGALSFGMKGKMDKGNLTIEGKGELQSEEMPAWDFQLGLDGVQLNQGFFDSLRYISPIFYVPKGGLTEEITGTLETNLHLKTKGMNSETIKKFLEATGSMIIKDGTLSGPPVMARILNTLGLGNIKYHFQTMTGSLKINEGWVYSDNLDFQGKPFSFKMNGKTSFDGNILFTLETVSLKGLGIKLPVDISKLVTVQIAGTWEEPLIQLKLPPINVKTLENILEQGLKILGE